MAGENIKEILRDVCAAKFDSGEPTDIAPPSTGGFNDSLFFTLDEREMVFRMAPHEEQGFLFYERNMLAQEPALHEVIQRQTDIPVAQIHVYDDSRQVAPRPYIIMQRLPGRPLSSAYGVDPGEVFRQVGRHLRQLHAITAQQYGYIGEHHPMPPAPDWTSAFEVMWNKLLDDVVDCDGYTEAEADLFRRLFQQDRHLFEPGVPAALLHMDIWHENILVDDHGQVTGLIDWDRALWGDVEIEFAVLDYCGISTPEFWQGYGQQRDTSPAAQKRGIYYYLYEMQNYIVIRRARSNNPQAAQRYRQAALQIAARM